MPNPALGETTTAIETAAPLMIFGTALFGPLNLSELPFRRYVGPGIDRNRRAPCLDAEPGSSTKRPWHEGNRRTSGRSPVRVTPDGAESKRTGQLRCCVLSAGR